MKPLEGSHSRRHGAQAQSPNETAAGISAPQAFGERARRKGRKARREKGPPKAGIAVCARLYGGLRTDGINAAKHLCAIRNVRFVAARLLRGVRERRCLGAFHERAADGGAMAKTDPRAAAA